MFHGVGGLGRRSVRRPIPVRFQHAHRSRPGRSSGETRRRRVAARPGEAADARLARFLRSTGEPDLEALQRRAVDDPAWFWGAAADDIAIPWQRRPREVLDLGRARRGPAGGSAAAFDWSWAAVEPRAQRDPTAIALTWEGEDGAVRELTNARAARRGPAAPPRASRRSASARATASGSSCRCCPRPSSRSSRSAGSGRSSRRSSRATRRRRSRSRLVDCEATLLITADGFLRRGVMGRSQVGGRRGRRRGAVGRARRRRPTRRRRAATTPWTRGRDVWWDDADRRAGRRRSRARCRDATPRRRTWSSTRRARPAGRRAPSTSTAASRSRPPRTSPTRST